MGSFSRARAQPASAVTQTGDTEAKQTVEDNRPGAFALRAEHGLIMNSPRMIAQRNALSGAFGDGNDDHQPNNTGMPDQLKNGLEHLSGFDLSHVRVHYNSERPASVGALAYAKGKDIHLAPGQEKYLSHEGWHVVQQMQHRVKPTLQLKSGLYLNDDLRLENEADVMGGKASQFVTPPKEVRRKQVRPATGRCYSHTVQRVVKPSPPPDAPKHAVVYPENGPKDGVRWHCVDRNGNHWVKIKRGKANHKVWIKLPRKKVPFYNRINFAPKLGRGARRAASFAVKYGSGKSYSDKEKKMDGGMEAEVKRPAKGKRKYRQNAKLALGTASATEYAKWHGAPDIKGGYNWCHLIGRGAGGPDSVGNLVAASTHANSEHLLIESFIYHYPGKLRIKHLFASFKGSRVAEKMQYEVLVNNKEIYSRVVDGFRSDEPDGKELDKVRSDLFEKIDQELLNKTGR